MDKGDGLKLVDIRQIPEIYRSVFAAYPSFNHVQSTVFLDVFDSDHSVVLSAPTGSGKTAIFELAIVRQLIAAEKSKYSNIFRIVYISPMKALCEERLIDWHKKFSPFGINSISITGDSDYMDYNSLSNHNLIITTPEKWDSITRRWKENKRLIQVIKLFMIDEVHLLNEENRGATLEAMVCRMKTIQNHLFDDIDENSLCSRQNIRFLAVSATFPNMKDVGDWLGAKYYSFESNMRPVKLNTIVLGFNHNRSCSLFKFDISLNYRLPGLILKHSNGKPTLIFCSTRKSVEMAAKHLVQNLTIPLNDSQKEILIRAASAISDTKLRSGIVHGIGYHHGGLLPETRSIIEQLFRSGGLPVLVTTSTLATGVNLPAHLVIIKSTKFYDKGGFQDYAATALLQMLGRAGRPQFDTEATALILTSTADMAKFEKMVEGKENIESNLHKHLTEHLNAEIVLRTITDLDVAMRWLSSTFLYIRARKNPRHYGIPLGLTTDKIDKKLLEICQIDLNKLVKGGMASMDEDVNISPTFLGTLMAKYYVSFESMKLFKTMNGNEMLQQILSLISKSKEFSDMRLRVDEKKCLNLLNKTKNETSIRFPFNGKIKTLDMKINCIIQAVFGCLEIEDHSILSEAFRIMRLGERICKCLIEYLESRRNCYSALLSSTILWKCFRAQLWENSKHLAKQFPGIGLVTSKQLVDAGKTTFEKIIRTNPRDIEMITKKKPPFGNKIIELAKSMPTYDMKVETIFSQSNYKLKICITLLNPDAFDGSTFVNADSVMCLLIGDNLNRILFHERYMHSYMLENIEVVRFVDLDSCLDNSTEVYLNFVSEDLVGIDISETFIIKESGSCEKPKRFQQSKILKNTKANLKTPTKKNDPKMFNLIQTPIDKYMKCKKNIFISPLVQPAISKSGKSESKKCEALSKKSPVIEGKEYVNPEKQTFEKSDNKKNNRYSLSQFDQSIIQISEDPKKQTCEKSNNSNEKYNRYNLSRFDQSIIEISEDREKQTYEKSKNLNEKNNRYNLSRFDQSIIEISEDPVQCQAQPLRSFTDEEILESVELLLDQNQISGKNDIEQCDDQMESRSIGTSITTDFLGADLDAEFSKIFDKYEKTKKSSGNICERNEILQKNVEKKNTDRATVETCVPKITGNALKNGKLHSAGSFENALFNPKKDSLTLFRYQPSKRFAHVPRENDPPSAPESKRKKLDTSNEKVTEDMMKNLENFIDPHEKEASQYSKSIKWRSPLIYSPPVKFSPKIPSSFSFSVPMPRNNDSENSHDWSMNTVETNNSSKTVRSFSGTTPDAFKNQSLKGTQNQGTKFLLSDREYKNNEKPMNYNRQTISVMQTPQKSQQIQDFFSPSFLENIGYSEKQKITSNTSVQSAGSYYHDMVAKNTENQRNSEAPTHMSQKPFFLNQNHSFLPENKTVNHASYNVIPNNNAISGQSFSQMRFVPQNVPIRSPSMNMTVPQSMGNYWLAKGHNGQHNALSGDVTRPDCHLVARNFISQEGENSWQYDANLNLENQHGQSTSSQPMIKYPLNENLEMFHNSGPTYPQSFTHSMAANSFSTEYNPQFGQNRPFELNQKMPDMVKTSNFSTRNFEDHKLHKVNGISNTYPPELENSNYFDRQNFNYPTNVFGGNVYFGNQRTPRIDETRGFFLNQSSCPQFDQGPLTTSLRNTLCLAHRIFNCNFCLDRNYSVQPNIHSLNGRDSFTRQKSFNAASSCATAPGNRVPEQSIEYSNNPSFAQLSKQYVNEVHQENSFKEQAGMPGSYFYGMQNYDQVNRPSIYGSDNLNTFERQNVNKPSEMACLNLQMDNDCKEDLRSMPENNSNKTFLLSRFLNSFGDSSKN